MRKQRCERSERMLSRMILSLPFALILLVLCGVFGVDADEVKSVSVMEGDSFTLHTNLTDIQRRDHILWKFGAKESRIAEIYKQSIDIEGGIEIFGDRLKLDNQTGSLTITDIRITDSGLYKLHIIRDRGTSYKRFNVTLYARLPVPEINHINNSSNCSSSSERSSVSKCVLLCSVMNVSHVSLSWYKGNSLLSNISVSDLNIRLSLPLEVEYHDTNTYRCVVNNPITNHTQHLNINQLCGSCSAFMQKPHWVGITIFLVILVVVTAPLGVMCLLYSRKTRHMRHVVQTHDEEELHYADTTFSARLSEISVRDCVAVCVCILLCEPLSFLSMLWSVQAKNVLFVLLL